MQSIIPHIQVTHIIKSSNYNHSNIKYKISIDIFAIDIYKNTRIDNKTMDHL